MGHVVSVGLVATTLAAATAIACAGPASAQPPPGAHQQFDGAELVPDSYIVVLKDRGATSQAVRAAGTSLTRLVGAQVRRVFGASLRGFSAHLTTAQADALAARPEVAYVEQNRVVRADSTQTDPPSWGLDRIDQRWLPLDHTYTYQATAGTVYAYVIDSGIRISHQEFGQRASYGWDFVDDDAVADDCTGHGTGVAGVIGGATAGVAKGINLVSVRVLGCSGVGTVEDVAAAVDWVTANAVKPAVANLSLSVSGLASGVRVLDDAVAASIASGVSYSVSAGNLGYDACAFSPARVPAAITVSATDGADTRPWSADPGPCVDIFAPGVDIVSPTNASDAAFDTASGTSLAAPHVTGAAALLLAADPTMTPQQVRDALVGAAHTGAVLSPGIGSPNKLLNVAAARDTVVILRSVANSMAVTTGGGTNPLVADRALAWNWEQFSVVDAGDGAVNLRAGATGMYVSAENAGAAPLAASRTTAGIWEQFQLVTNADGTVSLKALINGKYVTTGGGTEPLIADRTEIGPWEEFRLVGPSNVVALSAIAVDWNWVTAEAAGAEPLYANRAADTPGPWETFDLVDLADGYVALRARANARYVTTGGTTPLIADRTAVGEWERFSLVRNVDGTVSLRAMINGRYVTDGGSATTALSASSTTVGDPEKFDLYG